MFTYISHAGGATEYQCEDVLDLLQDMSASSGGNMDPTEIAAVDAWADTAQPGSRLEWRMGWVFKNSPSTQFNASIIPTT